MVTRGVLAWMLVASFVLVSSRAAVFTGSLQTPYQWAYLSKFCFSNEFGGQGDIATKAYSTTNNTYVLIYLAATGNVTSGDWYKVYSHRPGSSQPWSCDKLSSEVRKNSIGQGTKIKIPSVYKALPSISPTQSSRPYWWFLAVGDCTSKSGLNIPAYRIEMTNPGGIWYHQFSFDEQGVGPLYIFYLVVYSLMVAAHIYGVRVQLQDESYHPIIRLLSIAIILGYLGVIASTLHYLVFAANGVGAPGILGLGNLLAMASQIVLMFLCILIAKGWAITTSYLSDKNILIIVMSVFVLGYLALFIWSNVNPDPASTLYFYESWPGVLVLLMRVGTAVWYLYSLRETIRLESLPEKRTFYIFFGGAYTLWFLALPLFVAIFHLIPDWYRFRAIQGLSVTLDFLGFAALAFLLWPSRASNYFVIKTSPQLLNVKEGGYYGSTSSAYDATNAL